MTVDEDIKETLLRHGYEYKEFIGKGGFSSVYLCRSQKYNLNFAVKRAVNSKLTEYEYNALVSLVHPNIIKLYDAFTDDEAHYLVMEYCPNKTLRQKGRLHHDQFVYYAKHLLEAISYCHSNNIAHRDIKPSNIFLDQYDKVKLADFGMAKQCEANSKSKYMCGSLMFFSPEILEYKEVCPFKADIWALGITFFYMITGTLPFESISLEEMKRFVLYGEISLKGYNVDPQINFLIKKMTEKNQKVRPNADQLLKLPLFQQNSNMKHCLFLNKSYPKNKARLEIARSKSVTFGIGNADFAMNNQQGNYSAFNVHSYKCDLLHPNIQKFSFKVMNNKLA